MKDIETGEEFDPDNTIDDSDPFRDDECDLEDEDLEDDNKYDSDEPESDDNPELESGYTPE